MNLQTKVYSHAVIYNDRTKDFLTQGEYDTIYNTESDSVWINGKYIRLSNIARIITASEYQEKYKEELPANPPEFPYEHLLPKPKYERINALKSMIAGFKKTCSEGNTMLPMMERKLKEAEVI